MVRPLVLAGILCGVEGAVSRVPSQGHLALTGVADEMRVMWVSNVTGNATVRFGPSADSLSAVATGSTTTYTRTQMCGAPANQTDQWVDPGMIHDVLMAGLTPGLNYYQVGDGIQWGDVKQFTNGPKSGGGRTKFIMFGDMGVPQAGMPSAPNSTDVILSRLKDTDVVIHIGDLAYAVGRAKVWEEFADQVEPIASQVPYHVRCASIDMLVFDLRFY